MKQLFIVALAASWFYVSPAGVAAAPRPQYTVHRLSLPGGAYSGVVRGTNQEGVAVGTAASRRGVTAEMWHLNPFGAEVQRTDLGTPKGYQAASLVAINNHGIAVGSVVTKVDSSGLTRTFPAYYENGSWSILSTPKRSSQGGYCEAIASDGTISASLRNPTTTQLDAATFSPNARGGYQGYHFLPLARGTDGSDTSSIFAIGGKTVIGGYQLFRGASGQNVEHPVIWVDGTGPYPINTTGLKANEPDFGLTGIYGARPAQVYAVGFGLENVSGVTATEAFVVGINVRGRKPIVGTPKPLPIPDGADFAYAATIGGAPSGHSMTYTIGGNVSDWAGGTDGALWTVSPSRNAVSINSFTNLTFSAKESGPYCPTYEVESIDAGGNGGGYAYCNGEIVPVTLWER